MEVLGMACMARPLWLQLFHVVGRPEEAGG